MVSDAANGNPLRTADTTALRVTTYGACNNQQPFSNLERLGLATIRESLKPIAWPFIGTSAKFFDEFSGIIGRRARNFES